MLYALKEKIKHGKYTGRLYSAIRFGLFGGKTKRMIDAKRKNLQKNGIKTIALIQRLLEQSEKKFYLDMGTLLGIIREGRILSHDLDIDVAVYISNAAEIEDFVQYLVSNGCVHTYSYVSQTLGVLEDSFVVNDIKFDINYYTTENGKDICYLAYVPNENQIVTKELNVVKLTCNAVNNTTKREFFDFLVNIPENPECYLAERYGENWRVPDKGWVYWKGPSTQPIDDTCKQIMM